MKNNVALNNTPSFQFWVYLLETITNWRRSIMDIKTEARPLSVMNHHLNRKPAPRGGFFRSGHSQFDGNCWPLPRHIFTSLLNRWCKSFCFAIYGNKLLSAMPCCNPNIQVWKRKRVMTALVLLRDQSNCNRIQGIFEWTNFIHMDVLRWSWFCVWLS